MEVHFNEKIIDMEVKDMIILVETWGGFSLDEKVLFI